MQRTAFSLTRLSVPHLKAYQGWPLFIDRDMLNRAYIKQLCDLHDESLADSGNDR